MVRAIKSQLLSKSHNYVCFGSDACTDTVNLYRIIGAFQNNDGEYEIKLIKYTYARYTLLGTTGDYKNENAYYWNYANYSAAYSATGYYNDWSYSQLNTVNLNDYYYNSFDSTWQDMIAKHTWIVGGNTDENINYVNALNSYLYEIEYYVTTQVDPTFDAKIGLAYTSDYYYAADSSYWNYAGSEYSTASTYNWMYVGVSWLITRSSSNYNIAFGIKNDGSMAGDTSLTVNSRSISVFPTFYLSSSVQYSSGSGTVDDPIILNVDNS